MMKKAVSLILALILAAGTLPALAEYSYEQLGPREKWTETQQKLYDSLCEHDKARYEHDALYHQIEQMGPREKWTDEQVKALGALSDEERQKFEIAYDDYEYDLYYKEHEKEEQQALIKLQKELGATNIGGINVKVDGKFVTFDPNVLPREFEYYNIYPARKVLEALGATVTADVKAMTATITVNGETKEVKLSDPNEWDGRYSNDLESLFTFFDPKTGSMFLDEYLLDELFPDYIIDYSYSSQTLYIMDTKKLIKEADKNFTIMNKLLAASWQDSDKTFSIDSSVQANGYLYGDKKQDHALIGYKCTSLVHGDSVYETGSIFLDLDDFLDTFLANLKPEEQAIFKLLKNMKYTSISNPAGGRNYINSPLVSSRMSPVPSPDVWVYIDSPQLPESQSTSGYTVGSKMYNGYSSNYFLGIPAPISIGELTPQYTPLYWLNPVISLGNISSYDDYELEPIANLDRELQMKILLFGDGAFNVRENGGVTTYTYKLDTASLKKLIAGDKSLSGASAFDEMLTFTIRASFDMKQDKVTNFTFDVDADLNKSFFKYCPIKLTAKFAGTDAKVDGDIKITGRYIGKIDATVSAVYTETTAEIPSAPPKGAKLVPLFPESNRPYPAPGPAAAPPAEGE